MTTSIKKSSVPAFFLAYVLKFITFVVTFLLSAVVRNKVYFLDSFLNLLINKVEYAACYLLCRNCLCPGVADNVTG